MVDALGYARIQVPLGLVPRAWGPAFPTVPGALLEKDLAPYREASGVRPWRVALREYVLSELRPALSRVV